MTKNIFLFFILFSFCFPQFNEVTLAPTEKNKKGIVISGEYLGTYMNYVHVLVKEKVQHYSCDSVDFITLVKLNSQSVENIEYNCSENTLSEEILFPPKINPMTGEWTSNIPDVFNREIQKTLTLKNKLDPNKSLTVEKSITEQDTLTGSFKALNNEFSFLTKNEIRLLIRQEMSIIQKEKINIKQKTYPKELSPIEYINRHGIIKVIEQRPEYFIVPGILFFVFMFVMTV
ncbi:hypothetical protein OAC91_02160 [Candidatus Marinimicrobia bacterium]|nr:hypothetical protein [Candidatus Neomarinimicrobiota bacterium]